jgi:hypothetical protein
MAWQERSSQAGSAGFTIGMAYATRKTAAAPRSHSSVLSCQCSRRSLVTLAP